MKAAEKGQLEVVKYLVKKAADINAQNENGETALMNEVKGGYIEEVKKED